jgi:2-amino-4-hydroxy-6-hydroxymethyldihydropteridine diphosphokinase
MRAYLGLGSNIGDGPAQIKRALELLTLQGAKVLRTSTFYRTEPVPPEPDQPWFTNCVAEVETDFSPLTLLRFVKAIERQSGRRRAARGGPRPIDIDVLLYEDTVVSVRKLSIPHPRMAERRFVLIPLKELAPALVHPVLKRTVSQMLRETTDRSRVTKMKPEL